ncbi:MAG: BON domain-containing protein, partial [Gammaproteobacteria bacterium]
VKLVGTVPSEQAKQQAGEEVAGLSGVRSVDNRLAVVGPALVARAAQTTPGASLTPPRFSIFSGERTTLRGSVPDQASADAALAAAAATFGASSVIDRLVPDSHVSNLPWVAPVLALGPLLKDVTHGSLEVDGLTLTLRGAVDTAEQRDRLAQAAMEAAGAGLRVDNRLVVKGMADGQTPRLHVVANSGLVTVSGSLPDHETADASIRAAGEIAGAEKVESRLTIDDGLDRSDWLEPAITLIPRLRDVDNGSLLAGDGVVRLTGAVDAAPMREQLGNDAAISPDLQVDNQLVVRERAVSPRLRIDVNNKLATVSGTVPNSQVVDNTVGAARQAFGQEFVQNRMAIGDKVLEPPWLGKLVGVTPHLKGIDPLSLSAADGQVIITGVIDSEARRAEVGETIARAVSPDLEVDNQLIVSAPVTPRTDPPNVRIDVRDQVATLSGLVADQDAIDMMVSNANKVFGAGNVRNRLIAGDAVTRPFWLPRVAELMPKLQEVDSATLAAVGDALTLEGTVASAATRDAIGADAADAAVDALRVDNRIVVARTVPPTLRMAMSGERAVLEGTAPDQETADLAMAEAAKLVGAGNVDNKLRISENITKPSWLLEAIKLSSQLKGGDPASLDISADAVTLTGEVDSSATRSAIGENAVAAVGSALEVDNRLTIARTAPPAMRAEVKDGRIMLSGSMPDQEAVDLAVAEAARLVGGASKVDNQLQISDNITNPDWLADGIKLTSRFKDVESAALEVSQAGVILAGMAASAAARDEIERAAESTVGNALQVDSRVTVARTIEPELRVVVDADEATVSGTMPNQEAVNLAAATAGNTFGVDNVTNELTVAEDITSPAWLPNAIELASEFKDIDPGSLTAVGGVLTLTGTVDSTSHREEIETKALAAVGDALRVDNQLVAEPKLQPVVRFETTDNRVVLTGTVPSQELADLAVATAADAFGAGNVHNQLKVDDQTANPQWLARSIELAPQMRGINPALLSAEAGVLTLAGTVNSKSKRELIGAMAVKAVAPALNVDNQLEVTSVAQVVDKLRRLGLEEITFETNSAEITPQGREILAKAVALMAQYKAVQFEVAGHTDASGDDDYNMQLSQQRADSVVTFLSNKGINPGRLEARGYGEGQPIAANHSAQGRAKNRRIEFRAIGK